MKTTTLNQLKEFKPCKTGLIKFLQKIGPITPDEPIPLHKILEINGIVGALWSARTQPLNENVDLAWMYANSVSELLTHPMACFDAEQAVFAAERSKMALRPQDAGVFVARAMLFSGIARRMAGFPVTKIMESIIFYEWCRR